MGYASNAHRPIGAVAEEQEPASRNRSSVNLRTPLMLPIVPSTELRRWFNHEPDKWAEFKRRYFKELHARKESLEPVVARVGVGRVTFVFASRELRFNNAAALKEYMERTI